MRKTGNGTGKVWLVKAGSGTLTLAGSSGFTGGITVNEGNLVGAAGRAFGAADSSRTITVNAGATLTFATGDMFGGHTTTDVPTIVVQGGTVVNASSHTELNNVILNNGTLTATADAGMYASWNFNGTITSYGNSTITYTDGNGNITLENGDGSPQATVFDVVDGTLTINSHLTDGMNNNWPCAPMPPISSRPAMAP